MLLKSTYRDRLGGFQFRRCPPTTDATQDRGRGCLGQDHPWLRRSYAIRGAELVEAMLSAITPVQREHGIPWLAIGPADRHKQGSALVRAGSIAITWMSHFVWPQREGISPRPNTSRETPSTETTRNFCRQTPEASGPCAVTFRLRPMNERRTPDDVG